MKNCVFDWRCASFTGTKFGGENPQSETRPHSSPDPSCGREISRVHIEAPRTARILGRQNPKKKKCPFRFRKNPPPRKSKEQGTFFLFGVAGVLASAWGFLRAYDLVSPHHARGACDIICFGNRCEFGTIETLNTKPAMYNIVPGGFLVNLAF